MRFSALCLCAWLFALDAQSQGLDYDDHNFRGLNVARIWIGPVTEDQKRCGITENELRTALELPINAYTKIRKAPVDAMDQPFISLTVAALRLSTGCVFDVTLEYTVVMQVKVSEAIGMRAQTIMLWRTGGVYTTGFTGSGRYVSEEVEALSKKLALAWQKANR